MAVVRPTQRLSSSNSHSFQLETSGLRRSQHTLIAEIASFPDSFPDVPISASTGHCIASAIMEEKRDSNDYHDLSGSSEDERPSISTESAQVLLMEGQNPQSGDIEAQPVATAGNAGALEYSIPTKIKCFYLTLYFALNLTLTLYNKAVLGKVRSQCPLSSKKHQRGPNMQK